MVTITPERFILQQSKPFSSWLLSIFLLSCFASVADALFPYAVKVLVNFLANTQYKTLLTNLLAFGGIILVWITKEILHRSTTWLGHIIFPKLRNQTREVLIDHLLHQSFHFYLQHVSSLLTARFTLVVNLTQSIISTILINYVGLLVSIVFIFILLGNVNSIFIGLIVLWLFYHGLVTWLFLRKGRRYSKLQAKMNAHNIGKITDVIFNFFAIFYHAAPQYIFKHLNAQQQKNVRTEISTGRHFEKLKLWQSLGAFCLICGAIATLYLSSKQPKFSVGDIPLVIMLIGNTIGSFWAIAEQWSTLINNYHQLADAIHYLAIPPSKTIQPTISVEAAFNQLQLEKIAFHYPNAPLILQNFSLTLHAKDHMFIHAKNGRGKTSLLYLLGGLLTPSAGDIYLNQQKLTYEQLKQWQAQCFVLPAKPVFLECSLLDNLRFINPQASIEEINTALRLADCDFIYKLPQGIWTTLKKNAESFSQGQRQRLHLAKIFLATAPIILLDEPFTHIDHASAKKILAAIVDCCQNKTLVIADHREYEEKIFNQLIQLN